jgi:hypothetical protein
MVIITESECPQCGVVGWSKRCSNSLLYTYFPLKTVEKIGLNAALLRLLALLPFFLARNDFISLSLQYLF